MHLGKGNVFPGIRESRLLKLSSQSFPSQDMMVVRNILIVTSGVFQRGNRNA